MGHTLYFVWFAADPHYCDSHLDHFLHALHSIVHHYLHSFL
jgi:hypothetical protein